MHPSGEVGRFQMDNLSSPPGDWCRSAVKIVAFAGMVPPG